MTWALALVSAAQFVLQLDFSIVNVALPSIQRELGFSPAELQWIVTGYAPPKGRGEPGRWESTRERRQRAPAPASCSGAS